MPLPGLTPARHGHFCLISLCAVVPSACKSRGCSCSALKLELALYAGRLCTLPSPWLLASASLSCLTSSCWLQGTCFVLHLTSDCCILQILVIALLMKAVLRRRFTVLQWEAMVLLVAGITVNQLDK